MSMWNLKIQQFNSLRENIHQIKVVRLNVYNIYYQNDH